MPVHAFIFPGQGSQAVGMGRDLAAAFSAAREVFQEVDETLKQKLSRLMFEGPGEELTLTENTQPALMAHSLAVLRVLEKEGGFTLRQKAVVVAGHSLGEYSALAAAGSFSIADAARLLKLRGQAMQKAVPAGEGAMAALLGAEMAQAEAICAEAAPVPDSETAREREVIEPANDNGAGQIVVSGHRGAVERAVASPPSKGVRRAMLLPVSAPFHCALMAPAADAMAEALENTPPRAPIVPLIANVSAAKATDPAEIRDLLVRQVTAMVRWRECVNAMVELGVDSFVELGAGKVLSGLIRRIAPDAATAVGGHAGGNRSRAEEPAECPCSGWTARRRWSPAPRAASARRSRARCMPRAPSWRCPARGATRSTRWPRNWASGPSSARPTCATPTEPDALVEAAEQAAGPLAILVNNAGMTRDMLALRMSDADWQAVLDVDLSAPFRLARAALRGMLRRRAGRIINISSIVGATGNAGQANYAAAKAGLVGMTKALAQEVASRGITVNAVAPGFVTTPMTDRLSEQQRTKLTECDPAGAAWASRRTWPPRSPIWPRTRRAGSPAQHCM